MCVTKARGVGGTGWSWSSLRCRRAQQTAACEIEWSLPMSKFIAFLNDETGATAAEYGLILALIAGVILVAVTAVGTQVQAAFNAVATGIQTAATTAA